MELYNESIENAAASWKAVQGLPDYKTLVGELLFREIFNISPGAINMFGFGQGVDCYHLPETLFKLPAFQSHTNGVVTMLEAALTLMLGKDMVSLADALSTLGSKHVTYGIQPPHYIIVETALVRTLELGLGDKFTVSLRKDWEAVFRFISRTMMMGADDRVEIVKLQRRTAERKKLTTLRLNTISQGKRSKALTRRSRTGCSRFEVGEQYPRRRYSDPPQQPTRVGVVEEPLRGHRSLSDLLDYDDDLATEDRTIYSAAETRTMTLTEHDELEFADSYWAWGNDSNVEPPKMPQRSSRMGVKKSASSLSSPKKPRRLPAETPVLVRHGSFDSVSSLGSVDSAPVFPRRASSPTRVFVS